MLFLEKFESIEKRKSNIHLKFNTLGDIFYNTYMI